MTGLSSRCSTGMDAISSSTASVIGSPPPASLMRSPHDTRITVSFSWRFGAPCQERGGPHESGPGEPPHAWRYYSGKFPFVTKFLHVSLTEPARLLRIRPGPTQPMPILCCFKGQFAWIFFVCAANGSDTRRAGYAEPTHWLILTPPSEDKWMPFEQKGQTMTLT